MAFAVRTLRRWVPRNLGRFSTACQVPRSQLLTKSSVHETRSYFSTTIRLQDFESFDVESKPHFVQMYENSTDAIKDIPSGCRLLVGGFGLVGVPENLIRALSKQPVKNLTVISNEGGAKNHGLDIMLHGKQVRLLGNHRLWSRYLSPTCIQDQANDLLVHR